MMIRPKGRKLLLLRSEYVPEKKRTIARTVVSIDNGLSTVPDEYVGDGAGKLTEAEREQVNAYLAERRASAESDANTWRLRSMSPHIAGAIQALENDPETIDQAKAEQIFASIAELRKALKRAGFSPAPKQTKKKSADAPENQSALDL